MAELSDRDRTVLAYIAKGGTPTGIAICRELVNHGDRAATPRLAHASAARLVRNGLARRLGTPKLRWYGITPAGSLALRPPGLRARAGEPCPNGCTAGHPGIDERPVLIERACDSPAMLEGLPAGTVREDDGERWCPQCWDYMGNELAGTA